MCKCLYIKNMCVNFMYLLIFIDFFIIRGLLDYRIIFLFQKGFSKYERVRFLRKQECGVKSNNWEKYYFFKKWVEVGCEFEVINQD